MAIQFGWYGTRGSGDDVTDPPVTEAQIEAWNGSALSVYVSYGLRTQTQWADWQNDAEDVVDLLDPSDDIRLIMEIPLLALNQIKDNPCEPDNVRYAYIDYINSTYGKVSGVDQDSRVYGFYTDEPNWPDHDIDDGTISLATARLGKDFIVMVRPAGASDASDPGSEQPPNVYPADQDTYSDYAAAATDIAGFWYPLASSSSEWANIEEIADTSGQAASMHFAQNNASGRPFWFAAQAGQWSSKRMPVKDQWDNPGKWCDDKWHSDELFWMMHRAVYAGAKGVLFYHFNKADANMHAAVYNMCDLLEYESANRALDTTPLATHDNPDTSWVKVIEGSDILWSYHYYSNSYWLLILDATPETSSGKPHSLKFQCKLGDQGGADLFESFSVLNQRYGVEQPDGRGTTIAASNNGGTDFKEFRAYNEQDYDYRLKQGEVKLYRFVCGP